MSELGLSWRVPVESAVILIDGVRLVLSRRRRFSAVDDGISYSFTLAESFSGSVRGLKLRSVRGEVLNGAATCF